jgi:hypothetical protein
MKKSKPKRQPTRDDLASALHTIRDQSQIIGLQAKTISRQQHAPLKPDANKRPIPPKKSKASERRSPDPYVN